MLQAVRSADVQRALIIVPVLPNKRARGHKVRRDEDAQLAEVGRLAKAIDLSVEDTALVRLTRPYAAAFLGRLTVQEFVPKIDKQSISLVIIDGVLSPVQQRNLERAWHVEVLDRVGLILEILGRRAKSLESLLQVELARLIFQRGRLVRSWVNLGRQRGSFGSLGGSVETQIESERRTLRERIGRLKSQIHATQTHRQTDRDRREPNNYQSVALVGYTNAGKSTLFNLLVGSSVIASSLRCITSDSTVRSSWLPHGTRMVLFDAVGFVSNLPNMLTAAFRVTLKEVTEADLIVHVRDITHPETEAQRDDIRTNLTQIGFDPDDVGRFIEVWNKVDVLDLHGRAAAYDQAARLSGPQAFVLSAKSGSGVDALRLGIEKRLLALRSTAVEQGSCTKVCQLN